MMDISKLSNEELKELDKLIDNEKKARMQKCKNNLPPIKVAKLEQLNIGRKLIKYSVLYLKDNGWDNEKIAIDLGIKEGTVRLIVKKYGGNEWLF